MTILAVISESAHRNYFLILIKTFAMADLTLWLLLFGRTLAVTMNLTEDKA